MKTRSILKVKSDVPGHFLPTTVSIGFVSHWLNVSFLSTIVCRLKYIRQMVIMKKRAHFMQGFRSRAKRINFSKLPERY